MRLPTRTLGPLVAAAVAFCPALARADGLDPDTALRELLLTRWTTEDGLPSNTLNDVVQSPDGYLWVTSYNGLLRFDGLTFTAFDQQAAPAAGEGRVELRSSRFYDLVRDADGTLWIGTYGDGVLSYRHGRFRLHRDGLRGTVRSILPLGSEQLWVGTSDFGAFEYRDGGFRQVEHPELRSASVRAIAKDADGSVWLGTDRHGLIRLNGGAVRRLDVGAGLASDAVTSLSAARSGGLWIGTEAGLHHLRGGEVTAFPELGLVEIYQLLEDRFDSLWLATEQGLIRRNSVSGRFERLTEHEGRPIRGVTALAFDREGSLWFSSSAGGLYQLRRGKFNSHGLEDGLASDRINSILEIEGGRVLVGTDDGTINAISREGVSVFPVPPPRVDVRIRDITRDRRGNLWISSYAGLVRIGSRGSELFDTERGLPTNQIRLVYESSAGDLWVGTRNAGLFKLREGERPEVIDKASGLGSSFVLSIGEDPEGRLLVGTREGLHLLDGSGVVRRETSESGLPGNIVFSTFTDAGGAVWISTNGGLARLHGGRLASLTSRHGLGAETVYDYRDDGAGSAWLSSPVGVIRLEKAQLDAFMDGRIARVDATVFDERDGLVHRECTAAARILKTRDGRLWFPTLGGVSVIDPRDVRTNQVPPLVAVSGLVVDGTPVEPRQGFELPPGTRNLLFRFSALSFVAPTRVQARYRLEGFEDDWNDAGSERSARYTNLPHGDYRFRVVAANSDGVWNAEGAAVAFRIAPHVYQTPAFYLISGLLAALGFVAAHRWRLRPIREKNVELEKIIEEQGKVEKALRESEEWFRVTFSEATDAMIVMDRARMIVDCNGRACEVFGYRREALVGHSFDRLFADPRDVEGISLETAVAEMTHRGTTRSFRFSQRRKDGSTFESELTAGAFELGRGRYVQAIIRDVSERARMERERKELIEELRLRNQEMERFSYTVSHDLKSPLVTIQGFLGLLEQDALAGETARMREDLERIRTAARTMSRLLDEILELSRIGRVINEPEAVPLSELAHEAVELVSGHIAECGATVDVAAGMPVVYGDRPRLLEVLQNLIENAIKFMGDQRDPRVEVSGTLGENGIVCRVRDNGIGIDPRYHDKVFELFHRLDHATEGTGIGLALVKRIVEVHGGRIWVESEGGGKGSCFCFELPADGEQV